jgi:hypothetical protein
MRPGQVAWEHINGGPKIYRTQIRASCTPHTSESLEAKRQKSYFMKFIICKVR